MGIENAVKWEIITGLCIIPPSKIISFISQNQLSNLNIFVRNKAYNHDFLNVSTVLSAVAMFFMPESPYYLIGKGKEGEALTSLQWYI